VLGAKDEGKLRSIVEALGERAEKGLEAKDFKGALAALRDMGLLSVVGHRVVSALLDTAKNRFSRAISLTERRAQTLVLDKDFVSADALLVELEQLLVEARAAGVGSHLLDVEELEAKKHALGASIKVRREEQANFEKQRIEAERSMNMLQLLQDQLDAAKSGAAEARKMVEALEAEVRAQKKDAAAEVAKIKADNAAEISNMRRRAETANDEDKKLFEAQIAKLQTDLTTKLDKRDKETDRMVKMLQGLQEGQERMRKEKEAAEQKARDAIAAAEAERVRVLKEKEVAEHKARQLKAAADEVSKV